MESDFALDACLGFLPGAVSRKETIFMLLSLSKTAKNTLERSRSKTQFWSDEETHFMLYQLKDMHILQFMDGRKTRN